MNRPDPARRRRSPLLLAVALTALLVAVPDSGADDECPASNPPNTLRIAAGSPQTAQLEQPFQTNLQVALANTNGCQVTGQLGGVAVTFSAPQTAPSGTFATSGTNQVTVGTDATGVATAPSFTANDTAGSYTVDASSPYGTVQLSLTNTANGVPASIRRAGTGRQQATANRRYGQPLRARVLDASGRPAQGVNVTFSLATGRTGASATFVDGATQATATTTADGLATSPPLIANKTAGRFTAAASVAAAGGGGGGEGGDGGGGGARSVTPASYRLENLAGRPAAITAGAASGQSTPVGTRFAIRLAVRVTDANANPVPGASVTFRAPARGASGRFTTGGRKARTAGVKTNAKGIAIAPAFTANHTAGGYAVIARVVGTRKRAAFALVNRAPR
jgi:protocatechuate 3,4-dioxygenase beta subunit